MHYTPDPITNIIAKIHTIRDIAHFHKFYAQDMLLATIESELNQLLDYVKHMEEQHNA